MVTLDSTNTVLVDKSNYWIPITPEVTYGGRAWLINKSAGVATLGTINKHEKFFTHYFPYPTFKD